MLARDSEPPAHEGHRPMRHSALTRRLDIESAHVWNIHYQARERRDVRGGRHRADRGRSGLRDSAGHRRRGGAQHAARAHALRADRRRAAAARGDRAPSRAHHRPAGGRGERGGVRGRAERAVRLRALPRRRRRRGRRLRAPLRDLRRRGRDPGRGAGGRAARRAAGLSLRPGRARARGDAAHAGGPAQHPAQPDRDRRLARGARGALPPSRSATISGW